MEWKQENNQWFCYKNSQMVKGWTQDNKGLWYHLDDKDGHLDTGWFQTSTDGDFWFYAYPQPTVQDGQTHCTGECATGWIQIGTPWFYLYPEKTTSYGISYPQCSMAIDWVKLGDEQKWYFLLKDSAQYGGVSHAKGECVCSVTLNINGQDYKFDENGVWQSSSTTGNSLVSDSLVEYVGGWEGLYTQAYADPYYGASVQSYWTIGYGTCYCAIPEAFPNGLDSTCTQEQALGWLKQEINLVAVTIKSALGNAYSNMSQQAFDCLCDIGYNAGTGALIGGNTWNAIISGNADDITTYVMSWDKANGVVSDGLENRCQSRVNMCLNGVYSSDH